MKRVKKILNSLLICLCILQACANKDSEHTNNEYFQYYVSTIHIENPRAVIFHSPGYLYDNNPMHEFVCPDSALKYCTDSCWSRRKDVFLLNHRSYTDEQGIFKTHGKWQYRIKKWNIIDPIRYIDDFNDTISIGHFYFEETNMPFVLSLQTIAYAEYDSRKPEGVPMTDEWDMIDAVECSNTYRLAVRPKYSLCQAFKMRRIYKQERMCYDVVELQDTTLYVPVPCK